MSDTTAKLSMTDLVGSLTGYEEDEIEKQFGDPIGPLLGKSLARAGRALIFIVERRDGKNPAEARDAAMALRLVDVNDRFLDDDEDADDAIPEEPDTELGKPDMPVE